MYARSRRSITGLLAGALAAASLWAPATMLAAGSTITVNTLSDDATAGNGLCSLREAVQSSNANIGNTNADCADGQGGEPDQIVFAVAGVITLGQVLPAITDSVEIDGYGQITVDGNGAVQMFVVTSGGMTLRRITVQDGYVGGPFGFGGAVSNGASVILSEATIRSSRATYGAGVHNNGSMTIYASTIEGNAATAAGGGIYNEGTLTVFNSTITGNTAPEGAGVYSTDTTEFVHATIARNKANTGGGGGIKRATGDTKLFNSVVVGNTGNQTVGSPSRAYSLVQSSADGVIDSALRDNGGPTRTIRLPAGSPALSIGDPDFCAYAGYVDQRGQPRPTGSLDRCDAGAVQRDRTRPTITSKPVIEMRSDTTLNGSAGRAQLRWAGADSGTGLERYSLQKQVNGGSWTTVSTSFPANSISSVGDPVGVAATGGPTITGRPAAEGSYLPSLTSGKTYRFRVRAVDEDQNVSDWAYTPTVRASLVQQTSSAIRYSSTGWSTASSAKYSGGSVKSTAMTGKAARFTFTGRSIALITTTRPTEAAFQVYMDGLLVANVTANSDPAIYRRQLYAYHFATSGEHTMRIVVKGGRVDIDGFFVLR